MFAGLSHDDWPGKSEPSRSQPRDLRRFTFCRWHAGLRIFLNTHNREQGWFVALGAFWLKVECNILERNRRYLGEFQD